jgi:5-formyltetrahydrofolate cyclo-ligase
VRGTFGIKVPRTRGTPIPPRWFNVIVVPLVGVDTAGRRLGMGGGFYDRAFAFRRLRRTWRGPWLVGVGFDCQRTDTVLADPWDLRLDSLATESGILHFSKGIR